MPRTPSAVGTVAVVVSALFFAFNGVVSKLAMAAGLDPNRTVQLRLVGAAVVMLAVVGSTRPGSLRVPRGHRLRMLVYGVVGIAMTQWLYLVAIQRLPVGLALLLEYTAPLMVALWVRFVLRQPVRPRVWFALCACLVGLTMVAQVGRGVGLDVIGVGAALGAAACLAAYYLLGEKVLATRDTPSTQTLSMTVAAVFWLVVQPVWTFDAGVLGDGVALPGPLAGPVPPLWVLVVWIVLLGTVVPYLLMFVGLRRLGAARTGLVSMLEPVAAAAFAWVVLGESMTAVQVVGAAVVMCGVVLAETARHVQPPGVGEAGGNPPVGALAP